MAVTAVDRPVDYTDLAKRSVAAGVITLILGSLLVGLETVPTPNGGSMQLEPRYRALICAAVGIAVVYCLIELIDTHPLGSSDGLSVRSGHCWPPPYRCANNAQARKATA